MNQSSNATIDRILELQQHRGSIDVTEARHQSLLMSNNATQETILKAFNALIQYMHGSTTKTQLVNQLDSISTPDVKHVVDAVQQLHETLKGHENTDLSPVTSAIEKLLAETKLLPKDHPKPVEIPQPIDYKASFDSLSERLDKLITTLEAKELVVHPPEVNVSSPQVDVHTDVAPLVKAVDKFKDGQADVSNGAQHVTDVSKLISEKFDKWTVEYLSSDFDDNDEMQIGSISYWLGNKKVAKLQASYDSKGNLTAIKKAKI